MLLLRNEATLFCLSSGSTHFLLVSCRLYGKIARQLSGSEYIAKAPFKKIHDKHDIKCIVEEIGNLYNTFEKGNLYLSLCYFVVVVVCIENILASHSQDHPHCTPRLRS